MTLHGKTVLITGSTSGIGEGIARSLATDGCTLVINGFGEREAIAALEEELRRDGAADVWYSDADMTKPDAIATMIAEAGKRFGGVDVLINNAGIQYVANIEDFPPEKWDAILAINLSSAYHTVRHAIGGMKARGWGRIINVASAHGLVASAGKAAYVAAKHGMVGMTKVVGLETAGTGVTCNAICPGWVLTPLVQKQINDRAEREGIPVRDAERDLLAEKQPAGEFVQVGHIGAMVRYLCSDDARVVTGTALSIDGGWTAQ